MALDRVSFQVHRRELMCVIGPSGCGKSTLARLVAGLEPTTGGQMLLDGKPIHGPGPDRGMVFQSYTLFPWLTVLKNVMFGMEVGSGMSQRRGRAGGAHVAGGGRSDQVRRTPIRTSCRAG